MNELISMSMDLHIFFVFLTLIIAVINLIVVMKIKDYIPMTKRVEFFTPLYYLSLSIVIFTGFVVLSVYHFQMKSTVYFMIVGAVVVIYGAFKTHKKFKRTRAKDIESQTIYRKFATNKYKVDIVVLLFVIILSFLFAT